MIVLQATQDIRKVSLWLTHHPHIHGIVPGGGLTRDGKTWMEPPRIFWRLLRLRMEPT